MDFLQFIVVTGLLFATPYVLPIVVGVKNGAFQKGQTRDPDMKPGYYWASEIAVCLAVLATTFYLVEIGTFNGLIDFDKFKSTPNFSNLLMAWEFIRYGSGVFGCFLGAFLVYRALKFRQVKSHLDNLLLSAGIFCMIYGFIQPGLIQHFIGAILDSHLIG